MASDTIYREVLRLKEGGKPVIVSMGNVAASGGYYISAPATKIVAQPSTVTGSIGVVSLLCMSSLIRCHYMHLDMQEMGQPFQRALVSCAVTKLSQQGSSAAPHVLAPIELGVDSPFLWEMQRKHLLPSKKCITVFHDGHW